MISLHGIVDTPLSQEAAFAFVTDFARLAEWDPGIASSARTTGDAPGVGADYRIEAVFMGRRVPMTYRTLRHEAPGRAVLEGRAFGFEATDDVLVEATPGGARVHWRATMRFTGPLRPPMRLLRPAFDRLAARAMDGLAEALAGRARVRPSVLGSEARSLAPSPSTAGR
jgi:carbon monoxide dehydrogenase subunit G